MGQDKINEISLLEYMPHIVILSILGTISVLLLLDFDDFQKFYWDIIGWIYFNKLWAAVVIIGFFAVSVLLVLPISFSAIPVGFACHAAFSNKLVAFLYCFATVYVGINLGSLLAFFVGKYLLKNSITNCMSNRRDIIEAFDIAMTTRGS